jgi:hypothetical protein
VPPSLAVSARPQPLYPAYAIRPRPLLVARSAFGQDVQTFIACDSLAPGKPATSDVSGCLDGLTWTPESFEVVVERPTPADAKHQAVLRFPSPVSTGDPLNDRVAVLWYQPPHNDAARLKPALVVVHESGSSMPVGKLFAGLFAGQGVHAFLVQLPNYGLRKSANRRPTGDQFLLAMRQGIADVRRARDAVAALPRIDPRHISVQGISLGGFVAATSAGLDDGFDQVFIMVAGGDLLGLVQNGQREAAELRERLETAGFTGDKLRELLWAVEPTRLAGRLDARKTWLYSAEHDRVVPIANALAFKTAVGLADEHHIRLPGDHVTTLVYLPAILDHVVKTMRRGNTP